MDTAASKDQESPQLESQRRKESLQAKFDQQSAQGYLPFTNELYFEQSNPILRSGLFSVAKSGMRGIFAEWTEIFNLGAGSIYYKGPALTVDHEQVLGRLMLLARGRSLTKPIPLMASDVVKWLGLTDTGHSYKKARRILDDLSSAELRIANKQALRRLYTLLTDKKNISTLPDGKFFQDFIENRFGPQLQMIASALNDGEEDSSVDISLGFINSQTHNSRTRRILINLDPIMSIFFDGVNTTLVPFEVLDRCDRFGKRLLPFIASHRDGVWPIKLQNYHDLSGSTSNFDSSKRYFKHTMKKRLQAWEDDGIIEPGWQIAKNRDGEEVLSGLKLCEGLRLRSKLKD
tara:strand:+ start:1215 stop:2252 length:1038 start_codon:yes stop_codon:yes gene_type:complete